MLLLGGCSERRDHSRLHVTQEYSRAVCRENRNKYSRLPLEHFKKEFDVDDSELESKLKKEKVLPPNGTLNDLKLNNFEQFLEDRKQMIVSKVKGFLEY